jgi:hypothetical protein
MRNFKAFILGLVVMTAVAAGCDTREVKSNLQQEARGLGIVQGTLGLMRVERLPSHASAVLQGQVLELEGGAYIARTSAGEEIRVPLDENTLADRPAHVGDHIEVHFDPEQRAIQIRNIDREIVP